ncbi:helix-turn-helix transcriptional regulator [Fluviicola sp.]|uniref:DUF6597 domain-containing transcriptional factor n=1 Tax=Fluviicola sp. TaxID=1917219 RepID=UPI0026228EDE|nr:helix-turn-helix transcriptional regulator [Fluviicola sp.]
MNYQTFEPVDELKAWVKCFWILEFPSEEVPEKQRIVPDGCMELIFHYGDLYRQYINPGESIIQPKCFVIGQLTELLEIEPTGATGIFAVRFNPEGFYPFSALPLKELENKAVDLSTLFGKRGLEIEKEVLEAKSVSERIKLTERFLLDLLKESTVIDRIVHSTVETIVTANGRLSIGELSSQIQIHRRQLERKFASTVGLSPKQLSRIVRLQTVIKRLLINDFTNLSALAHEEEYFDQAHFIKDFKEFTGLTPKEFYGDDLKLSALFYGSD